MQQKKLETCSNCDGSGIAFSQLYRGENEPLEIIKDICPECDGTGIITENHNEKRNKIG